ncbi:DUF747-domain-containing protein [Wallemia mellicola]|uniref:DUF747-domain-containing protein n=1 Tax=Wallemia mellicola TaxID=1708541 RepID=A0A4T0PRG8_9BASI|nr:hypothetical protein E3Q23_03211 [Wallemia mellicola]TIB93786.1 DUF747-domain-containing protein [Wallemia mellicola]TIC00278.1 DUF747-domain-containing protein [Wallemia mellicola]TIC13670.1 DUF747-domain-containing protein [Wallemia mellicola]TIC69193.1 DUF747-domain-containing protein [Wallemia mellicola]
MTNDFYYSEPSSPQESQSPCIEDQITTHSLLDYLKEELRSVEIADTQHYKSERVSNFLQVPLGIEKVINFGSLVCLDSFLYTFTILPLRATFALLNVGKTLNASQKADILKMLLFLLTSAFLLIYTEPSRMYHGVRGQDNVKLYVIFNALEIADKLCCSIGQDILDSLFSRTRLTQKPSTTPIYLALAVIYAVAHSLVFLYQLVALNVAVNSYDNALLTLLLSNQFVEIKGSVFKRFDKSSLFQITCADIVERFQLMLMLTIIACRNLIELSGSNFAFLPRAFIRSNTQLETIFSPVVIVILSEMAVDWLKHAFITKFMHIRPSIYGRFVDILAGDLVSTTKKIGAPVDLAPKASRRLGFAAIPLGAFVVRVAVQALGMLSDSSSIDECATLPPSALQRGAVVMQWFVWLLVCVVGWLVLLAIKLLLGIRLSAFAHHRQAEAVARRTEDVLTNLQTPIGEGNEDKDDRIRSKQHLSTRIDDVPNAPTGKIPLEELSRYDMVKRIW